MITSSEIAVEMESDLPSVAKYYSAKSVFITGGTGFIGKVLIEKLLRSCPNIDKVYLLIRPKRSQDIEQRMDELVNCPVRGFVICSGILDCQLLR